MESMESDIKAWMRATRERVGLTQKDVADLAGVTTDMVKKWESEKYVSPPDDVIRMLQAALDRHRRAVTEIVDDHAGDDRATLTYYRSQAQADQTGGIGTTVGLADARIREAAAILERDGMKIDYTYPR